jgi:hypothetical protein
MKSGTGRFGIKGLFDTRNHSISLKVKVSTLCLRALRLRTNPVSRKPIGRKGRICESNGE